METMGTLCSLPTLKMSRRTRAGDDHVHARLDGRLDGIHELLDREHDVDGDHPWVIRFALRMSAFNSSSGMPEPPIVRSRRSRPRPPPATTWRRGPTSPLDDRDPCLEPADGKFRKLHDPPKNDYVNPYYKRK